jgi:hypothetical protein
LRSEIKLEKKGRSAFTSRDWYDLGKNTQKEASRLL